MADNTTVVFGADISNLTGGMKDAAKSVEEATKGMSGNMVQMLETMEKFGPAAIALAGVGIAFEALKESLNFVNEEVENTNKLTESFRSLGYITGTSQADLNAMTMALEMSGGSVSDLDGLLKGMTRGVKANSDVLVANGMAANEASLRGMSFVDYLSKAAEVADEMAPGQDRELFLMQALGKAGVELGDKLHEMVEHMKEAKEEGSIINPAQTQQLKDCEAATARLEIAQQKYAATVASSWAPISNWFKNLHAAYLERGIDQALMDDYLARGLVQYQTYANGEMESTDHLIQRIHALRDAEAELYKNGGGDSGNDVGASKPEPKKKDVTKEDLEKKKSSAKEAAEEAQRLAEAAEEGKVQAAKRALEQLKDLDNQEVADGRMTAEQRAASEIAGIQKEVAAEIAAIAEREAKLDKSDKDYTSKKLAQQNKVAEASARGEHEIAAVNLASTKSQEAAVDAWSKAYIDAHKQAAKLAEDADREASREAIDAAKDALEAQKSALDEKVSEGLISGKEEIAQRLAFAAQERDIEIAAKNKEMADLDVTDAQYANKAQKLANQELDIQRKYDSQVQTLDKQTQANKIKTFDQVYSAMTSGFSSSISGLIMGTQNWGQAIKNVFSSALSSMINFFAQWAIQAAATALKNKIFQTQTNTSQAAGAAAVYAVNAASSVAAIPVYGWAMAEEVGASAYGEGMAWAGMASAKGGWDNVPNDQIMKVHEKEMVLSAPIADTVRNAVGKDNNSAKSNTVNLNVSSFDSKSFHQYISKPANQRAIKQLSKSYGNK